MIISNELRVGIMFFTGLVLLVLLIVTLTRWGQDRNAYSFTIRFKQAQGIQEGAEVRVSGVKVGQVGKITLDQEANVAEVAVWVDKHVVLYTGYAYSIGVGGLVGEKYIEIRPRDGLGERVRSGDVVLGTSGADMNDLMKNTNKVILKLSTAADSLNEIIGDKQMQRDLKSAVADMRKTAATSAVLAENMNNLVKRNAASIDYIVADLLDVAGDIRRVSDSLSPQLENTKMIANLEEASENTLHMTERLEETADSIKALIDDPAVSGNLKETIAHLKQASADMEATMADARKAVAVFPEVSANVKKASDDLPEITKPFKDVAPEAAKNLLELSRNLRAASESVSCVAQRVTKVGASLSNIRVEPEARLVGLTSGNESTRSDVNVDIFGQSAMLRVGVADLEDTNTVNLQFGNPLRDNLWFRYGVVQSTLGVGADWEPNEQFRISGELFDPEDLRANALLNYRLDPLGPNWWLTGGWFNLFSNEGSLGLGMTYRP